MKGVDCANIRTSLEAEIDIRRADDETKKGANEDGTDCELSGFFGCIRIRREGVAIIYKAQSIPIIVRSTVQSLVLKIRQSAFGGLGSVLVDWELLLLSWVCEGIRVSDLGNASRHGERERCFQPWRGVERVERKKERKEEYLEREL